MNEREIRRRERQPRGIYEYYQDTFDIGAGSSSSSSSSGNVGPHIPTSRFIHKADRSGAFPEPKIDRGVCKWDEQTNLLIIANAASGSVYSGLGARGMAYFLHECHADLDTRPRDQRKDQLYLRGPAAPVLAFQNIVVDTELECSLHRETSASGLLFNPSHMRLRSDAAKKNSHGDDEGYNLTYVVEALSHPVDSIDPIFCVEINMLVCVDSTTFVDNENWYSTWDCSPKNKHNNKSNNSGSSNSNSISFVQSDSSSSSSNSESRASSSSRSSSGASDFPAAPQIIESKCLRFSDVTGRSYIIELPRYHAFGRFIRKICGDGAIIKGYRSDINDPPSTLPITSPQPQSLPFSPSNSSLASFLSGSRNQNRRSVAIKIAPLASLPTGRLGKIADDRIKEVAAMQYVRRKIIELKVKEQDADKRKWIVDGSKYIVNIIECITDGHYLYIVMDLLEGYDLGHYIELFKWKNRVQMFGIWSKIARGVFALHSSGICHRDISMENVILVKKTDKGRTEYTPVIIDLGLCQMIPRDPLNPQNYCKVASYGNMGKPYYFPLETMVEWTFPVNGFACDMWQLGILMLIMMVGKAPFRYSEDKEENAQFAEETFDFYKNVRNEDHHLIWNSVGVRASSSSSQAKADTQYIFDIFKRLVRKEKGADNRLTALELLQHLNTISPT